MIWNGYKLVDEKGEILFVGTSLECLEQQHLEQSNGIDNTSIKNMLFKERSYYNRELLFKDSPDLDWCVLKSDKDKLVVGDAIIIKPDPKHEMFLVALYCGKGVLKFGQGVTLNRNNSTGEIYDLDSLPVYWLYKKIPH
jgi:hypothetical protein